MAGADYNGIEGLFRIADASEKLETFAVEVITFHAALEYELDIVLSNLMPNPDAIIGFQPALSFTHKARLLLALWKGDTEKANKLNEVLRQFEDLRNIVAHPRGKGDLKSKKAKLDQAYREIEPTACDDPTIFEITQGTAMFMADKETMGEFEAMIIGLNRLVNDDLPRIFKPSSEPLLDEDKR